MATRIVFWLVGLVAAFGLAFRLVPVPWLGVGLLVVLIGLLAAGLLFEVVALARGRRVAQEPPVPVDTRQADGTVDVVPLIGARGDVVGRDSRFRRFRGFSAEDPGEPGRQVLHAPPPLRGRVVLVSVFIGRDGTDWSAAEIARAHAALTRAGEWIERQAIRWQAPVNVALAETYFATSDDHAEDVEVTFVPEGQGAGPFEADATVKAVAAFSRAARSLGFRDAVDLTARAGRRVEADALVWLIHPRRAGRSHAVRHDDDTPPGVALAVCYAREANFPEPLAGPPFVDPVTVAHELMHLFGATDKYGVPLRTFPPRSVTDRDVMCLNFETLSRLRVDMLTAEEIGWRR